MQRRFRIIRGKKTGPEHRQSSQQEISSFEEALLTHLDSLFAFALRLVSGQTESAKDLVQEVCLKAFRSYRSVHFPEKTKPWLFQIMVNTHINEFHQRSRQLPIADVELSEALLESALVPAIPSPEEELFEQVVDDEIQRALETLPVGFRTVVWLSDVEELSYQEISEILNCPPGTVASRLYRGHSLLRERLREFARKRRWMED